MYSILCPFLPETKSPGHIYLPVPSILQAYFRVTGMTDTISMSGTLHLSWTDASGWMSGLLMSIRKTGT